MFRDGSLLIIERKHDPMRRPRQPLPALIEMGRAEPKPDVRPCEWCRRPTVWEFSMPGAARPVRACNDLCAKKALRLAERQEVPACRPDHAEKALGRSGGEGLRKTLRAALRPWRAAV